MKYETRDQMQAAPKDSLYDAASSAMWPHSSGEPHASAKGSVIALIAIALLACLTAAVLSPPPPDTTLGAGISTD